MAIETEAMMPGFVAKDIGPTAIELKKTPEGFPFVDFIHTVEDKVFRFVSKGAPDVGSLSFEGIANLITKTPGMTGVSAEQLQESWQEGLSTVVVHEGKIVGHARLKSGGNVTPKNEAEARILGSEKARRAYELASVILVPEEQGKGLGPQIMEAAMGLRIEEVRRGEAMLITTTEAPNFPRGLHETARKLGIRFIPIVHTDVEGIAREACDNCAGRACTKRVSPEEIRNLISKDNFPEKCVAYYSVPLQNGEVFHPSFPSGRNGANHVSI